MLTSSANGGSLAADFGVQVQTTMRFAAERIYHAWTDPKALGKWFPPPDCSLVEVSIDACVGGRYRVAFSAPDWGVQAVVGEYVKLVPGRYLMKTWMLDGVVEPHQRSVVKTLSVSLSEAAGFGTSVLLVHQGETDPELRVHLKDALLQTLARLEAFLARQG